MNMHDRDRIRYLLTLLKAENVSEQDRQSAYEQLADSTEALLLAYEDMKEGINAALHRYDNPDEPHNKTGGFPRRELAWAMANDLRKVIGE